MITRENEKWFRIARLLARQRVGQLSEEELRELEEWREVSPENKLLYDRWQDGEFLEVGFKNYQRIGRRKALLDMEKRVQLQMTSALVHGSWQNWAVAAFTLIVVMVMSNKGKGICKLAAILLGMIAGYIVAAVFGMVDLSEVRDAAWFSLPQFMHFGIKFEFSACIALALLFAINAIQAIGDLTATTVGGLNREPTDQELQGGIVTYGLTNVLSAFFGSLPTATYSQNVGIVTTNKVVNRVVFALAGGFLLLAGLIPKFSAILTTIPQCVLGGATITVFSTIAMTGMKLIASETISPRNTTIVGLSAALGVGISQSSSALSQFPESITIIFGKTPVVIATIMAVLLNLILPQENTDQ